MRPNETTEDAATLELDAHLMVQMISEVKEGRYFHFISKT